MTEERKREQKPWYPTIEREPELNPFVSPQHSSDELDNPVFLENAEDEENEENESVASDRVVPETIRSTPAIAAIKPAKE
jgi:hypothetical protein